MVAVCIAQYDFAYGVASVTDNQIGNSYVSAVTKVTSPSLAAIYYAKNVNSVGSFTVSVNLATAGCDSAAGAISYTGVDTTSPLSGTPGSANGFGTTASTGSMTQAEANALYIGCFTYEHVTTTAPVDPWTQRLEIESAAFSPILVEDQITTGAQTATCTIGTTTNWVGAIAAFKAATGFTGAENNQAQKSDQAIISSLGTATLGPLYPITKETTAVAPYSGLTWVATSVTNIGADDTAYASLVSASYDTGTISFLLVGRDYAPQIPARSTINGLLLEIGKWYSAGSARDSIVTLINGPGTIIGSNLGSTGIAWPSSIATISYGGATNTWGTTLTPAMVNGTNFGFAMAAVASALNTDIWADFLRMTVYYTLVDGSYGITPDQNYQAQVSDAAMPTYSGAGGATNITPAEAWQAQVSDPSTLGVWTPIAPAEDNQAQKSDAALLSLANTDLTAAQNFQAQVSDIATFGVIHSITPAQNSQAQVSDAAPITAQGPTYSITPAEGHQAQVSEKAPPDYHQPEPIQITPAQNFQAQVSDLAVITLTGATNITVAEGKQAQVSDTATFGVITPITTAEGNQAQVSDAVSVTFNSAGAETNITPAEGRQAQVSDAALLGVLTPITVAEGRQAQTSDAAVFGVITPIAPAQDFQAQVSDPSILGVISPVTPAQNFQAQASDAAGVTFSGGGAIFNITVADGAQAQVSDAAIVGAITPITPAQGNQAQVSDASPISSITPIAAAQDNQAQVSDAAIATFLMPTFYITVADATQAQNSDMALLQQLFTHGERLLYPVDARTTGETGARPIDRVGARTTVETGARSTYSVNRRDTGEVDD
jgi:hypothetical protein